MTTRSSNLVWVGFLLITASLGIVQFSLFAAQSVFFVAAAIVWIVVAIVGGLVVFGLSRLIAKSPGFPRL